MEHLQDLGNFAGNNPVAVGYFSHVNDARGHITSVNQDVLKAFVRLPDFFDHGSDKGHQRFATQGWADIAKRYLAGSVYLRVGIVWGDGAIGLQVTKQYAVIKVARPAENDFVTAEKAEIVCSGYPTRSSDSDEFHMLVDVCHSENCPENFIPSVVRLCSDDGLSQIAVEVAKEADHSSVLIESSAIGLEVFPAIPGGELNFFGFGWPFAQSSERNGGLVECRTQLVDDFTSQHVHDLRRARIHDDLCEFVSRLGIRIENNPARVRIKKLTLGNFKLDEVVICAL